MLCKYQVLNLLEFVNLCQSYIIRKAEVLDDLASWASVNLFKLMRETKQALRLNILVFLHLGQHLFFKRYGAKALRSYFEIFLLFFNVGQLRLIGSDNHEIVNQPDLTVLRQRYLTR